METKVVTVELTEDELALLDWLFTQVQYSFSAADVTVELAEQFAQHLQVLAQLRQKLREAREQ